MCLFHQFTGENGHKNSENVEILDHDLIEAFRKTIYSPNL